MKSCLLLSLVLTGTAAAQAIDHTLTLDPAGSEFTWELLTPLGPVQGVPDNKFQLSGTTEVEITEGEIDPFSTIKYISGDLQVPYIKGEIPGLLLIELKLGAKMTITSEELQLGATDEMGASGYRGTLELTDGDLWVDALNQGWQIIPLAGGRSDPFPVLGEITFDYSSGDMRLVAPVLVEFEINIAGVPMFFNIKGSVAADYDCPVGDAYCSTAPNSAGPGAMIAGQGGASYHANSLTLATTGCPPNGFGLYLYGTDQIQANVGDGFLCVGGTFFRLPPTPIDASGQAIYTFDVNAPPDPAGQVSIGETWNYQLWYRDTAFGGAGYNFSDALSVQWRL